MNPDAAPKAAAALPRLPATAAPETALAQLNQHGVVIVEAALAPESIKRLTAELQPWFAAAAGGRGPFFGRATRRFSGLFAKSRASAELALHPLVLGLAEAALPRCDAIELNLTQAIGIEPGEPAQVLHRDEEFWPFPHDFELMVNVMWTLDPFTERNGATQVAPGSHLWPRDRWPCAGELTAATAPAGSAIVWLGGLLHGGGANTSTALRRGVVMSYRLGWLAGAERLLLSIPPEVARTLPDRLQRLIGYQLHRPNLGWVEGRDPRLWLTGELGELGAVDDNLTPDQTARLATALGEAA